MGNCPDPFGFVLEVVNPSLTAVWSALVSHAFVVCTGSLKTMRRLLSSARFGANQQGRVFWQAQPLCRSLEPQRIAEVSNPRAQSDRGRKFFRKILTREKCFEPHGELGVGNEYQTLSRDGRVTVVGRDPAKGTTP